MTNWKKKGVKMEDLVKRFNDLTHILKNRNVFNQKQLNSLEVVSKSIVSYENALKLSVEMVNETIIEKLRIVIGLLENKLKIVEEEVEG